MPLAGILPEIAKYNDDFRAVGLSQYIDVIPYTNTDITKDGKFQEIIDQLEHQYKNQVIFYRLSTNYIQSLAIFKRIKEDLKGKRCRILNSSFRVPMYICVPKDWNFK